MHIPDGFLNGPVLVTTGAVAAGACAVAAARARRTLGDKQVPMLGVTSAFIFAAQMLNFPVLGGTSGHFCGAALATVLLGPWNACLVMAVVLVVQALVFFDGGLLALGANIFNMGVVGAFTAWAVHTVARKLLGSSRKGMVTAGAAAAWTSLFMAAGACALELGLSGRAPMGHVLGAMLGVHALIGIGEAVITTAVLATLAGARPDLIPGLTLNGGSV